MMAASEPIATYRLQLDAGFDFDKAAAIVPYLKQLGISHLYASPFMQARAGSRHGYDVVDYGRLNPELGGEAAFLRLSAALAAADMGLILDFVPNHMAVLYADNPWWLDVLEWGPHSPHAAAFDIDWSAHKVRGRGRVLLPILGQSYGEALARGEIKLRYDAREGSFSAWYYEHRMPIAPRQYASLLRTVVASAQVGVTAKGRWLLVFAADLEREHTFSRDTMRRFKEALAEIDAGDVIARGLEAFSPTARGSVQTANLHLLLERQHYRLAHWRLAASDLNYRRFFDISSLAGLRVEDAGTFAAIHPLVENLIARGELQGLRIDHIDGLYDPGEYCQRLHELVRARLPEGGGFYVVMEKILGRTEPVPKFSGVAGTTGYEWLNVISRVLMDGRGLAPLDRIWRGASGEQRDFRDVLLEAKRHVLEHILAAEFTALVRRLTRIAAGHYSNRDYSGHGLRAALKLFVLHFPVYRTYVTPAGTSPEDRKTIETALAAARAQWSGADAGIFDFLRDVLTLDLIRRSPRCHSVVRVEQFACKMQQFTGPVMAKSLEDTAFYRHYRLIALNEVGGDPDAGAISVAEFHELMERRSTNTAQGLTATATHDTKRGEDARARLLCLSELSQEWAQAVAAWRNMNAHLIDASASSHTPSAAHEYLLYQALLGAWPLDGEDRTLVDRIEAFAIKAAREGKEQTSWLNPNEWYEAGLKQFVHGILDSERSAAFVAALGGFARRLALMGALTSLSQIALKCTMPGVPDFYQGTDLWDLSLVDPDNRRPIDFAARAAGLQALGDGVDWRALAQSWIDGRIKLALTARLLALRQRYARVFSEGDYRRLEVEGRHRDEILAFARCHGGEAVIVIVARLFHRSTRGGERWPAGEDWSASIPIDDLAAPARLLGAGPALHEGQLAVAEVLDGLPVALLRAVTRGPKEKKKERGRPGSIAGRTA